MGRPSVGDANQTATVYAGAHFTDTAVCRTKNAKLALDVPVAKHRIVDTITRV